MKPKESYTRYSINCESGLQVRGYALYDESGNWLGDVALDYSTREHTLRLYCITDFGNYAYKWAGAGDSEYANFLLNVGNGYIVEKLVLDHNGTLDMCADSTRRHIWTRFSAERADEDADWLEDAHADLNRCEDARDFYEWAAEYDFEDVCDCFEYSWGWRMCGLNDSLLPELKRMLRKEVDGIGEKNNESKRG